MNLRRTPVRFLVFMAWIKEWKMVTAALNEAVQLMVSSVGQTCIRLMANRGRTSLIIFFALHFICPLSSLGCEPNNGLPMCEITYFQVLSDCSPFRRTAAAWPISQTHTRDCKTPFLLLTTNWWKLLPEGCAIQLGVPLGVKFTGVGGFTALFLFFTSS